ncbi:MAG: MBL fold metallo-hydrolase [Deltaproteobacteria bacterium]|nr:MBL fold metallo-hydrolase [Deltaproteobacteria bacterium]
MKPRPFSASAFIATLATALVFVSACHEPLAVPRVEPSLDGWTQPYQGVQGLKIHAFRTGAVRGIEAAAFAGGSWTTRMAMGAWAFVIEHPTQGLIVFDTGLGDRARTEPEHFVGWIGAKLAVLDVPEHATLGEQMKSAGLDPGDVHLVVLSHLHFDHTGDIGAFPNATVAVAAAEKNWAEAGVRRIDFVDADALIGMSRWQPINYETEKPLATFVASHDFFGDGSVIGLDLAGHTPGNQGLLVRAAEAPVLLAGDAAWTEKSWRWTARPISAWDMSRWWEQIWRINKFAMLEPRLIVVPGHDDLAVASIGIASFVHH